MIALTVLSTTVPAAAATQSPHTSEALFLSTAENNISAFDVPSSFEQLVDAHRYHGDQRPTTEMSRSIQPKTNRPAPAGLFLP